MTTVLDRATAHFRRQLDGRLFEINVPEWETTIYFKSTMTLKEQSKLVELATSGRTTEALVETLITKARNADGTKMFREADRVVFMNEVDPQILIRVVGEINGKNDEATAEEIEKN